MSPEMQIEKDKPMPESKKVARGQTNEKPEKELWISARASSHTICVNTPTGVVPARFSDYKLECDLATQEGQQLSAGLRSSGRQNVDIFVVGEALPNDAMQARVELMHKLQDMDVRQLRAIITLDDLINVGIPPNTKNRDELIMAIMKLKSL